MHWSAEDKAIDYLPHIAQLLYLRVLRRHADIDSGIVGLSVHLNHQMIRNALAVRSSTDIRKPMVVASEGTVRAALKALQRAGLIKPMALSEENQNLVFSLPLLDGAK